MDKWLRKLNITDKDKRRIVWDDWDIFWLIMGIVWEAPPKQRRERVLRISS